ncbi:uncharacterized protein LOC128995862 isoform X1 [Macrosteles quadrilineatus]|uniref:uncharacterized protein LOC128995862 isoform X1 n=1 Tax=Macrosteles quadrilineatus TaxID=74068 RepID=UPI0023E120E8|nr:uncharacterized protein LOC128995862 isoform X1 [Macrosteles quadrilineatus]
MESSESPLDVLSRAATMVQDNILPPSYDEARSYAKCKDVPTAAAVSGGKWRRERRPRPPEYPHKSSSGVHSEPIDMSTRRPRGSPPSYTQSLCYSRRPTVITTVAQTSGVVEEGGVCDPVIDEHFRRSLGKDYMSVFADTGKQKKSTNTVAEPEDASDLPTPSSLSVDDHFAKALGETWLKLQKGETSSDLRHRPDTVAAVTI